MKGLILSGGKGTRLYPLTYTRAKQLIPVANKPVLFRVIEAIRDAGISEIGIVVNEFGETRPEIEHAVGDGSQFGDVKITFIPQNAPLGLAHAVKISRDFLGDERFVMFLGDNVIQGGISELIRDFEHNSRWNSQIVLTAVEQPQHYGVAVLDDKGRIKNLVEKPKQPPSNLALVGIYMFDHHIFEAVNAIQPSGRGELEITDAIQWLVENSYEVYPYVHTGWWIDTGKPRDMLDANGKVLEEMTPQILTTDITDSEIDARVTIAATAKIENSVIRGPAIIGEHTIIKNSYIGPFTSIYNHVYVENCEIERSIILENARICNVPTRLQDSLIGRNVDIDVADKKPRALKLNLGDHSKVRLAPWETNR